VRTPRREQNELTARTGNQADGQPNGNDHFGYDYSGQLTSASYGWNGRSVTYSQDKLGNRSQVNDNGNVQGYSRNGSYLNQYIAGPAGPVSNGSEHEVAGYEGLSYSYIGDQRLASVSGNGSTYDLAYDALGRCVKRTLNGTTIYYTYDGPHPIYEWKSDGTIAGWNLYGQGIDEILLRAEYLTRTDGQGQGFFYQQNRLGSVTHLTGFSGEVIESYRYDAFGQPTTVYNAGGIFNNRFKFTGREYQAAFGIYEYRNRAYHPGLGRFLSEDPMGFAAGDSNMFRYCGGDPVNRRDPSGFKDHNDSRGPNVPYQNEARDSGSTEVYYGSDPFPDDVSDSNPLEGIDETSMDRVTVGGPPGNGTPSNAGIPGGIGNPSTGIGLGSGSQGNLGLKGDGSGPGGAGSGRGNGAMPGLTGSGSAPASFVLPTTGGPLHENLGSLYDFGWLNGQLRSYGRAHRADLESEYRFISGIYYGAAVYSLAGLGATGAVEAGIISASGQQLLVFGQNAVVATYARAAFVTSSVYALTAGVESGAVANPSVHETLREVIEFEVAHPGRAIPGFWP